MLCVSGGMVYTLVLEASAARIESSSLSLRTKFLGIALQAVSGAVLILNDNGNGKVPREFASQANFYVGRHVFSI